MAQQGARIGEAVVAEGQHRALGADVDLGDVGLAAEALDGHDLEQAVGLGRQRAEAVDQLGGQGLTVLGLLGLRQPAVHRQAHVEVGDVVLRDQHGRAGVDQRRPAPVAVQRFSPLALAQLGDGVLQHLLVELDADLLDMAALLVAQQVAAAPDVEVVAGQLEAGAQTVERLQHLQPLLGRQGQLLLDRGGQVGVGPGLRPADAAADLVQLGQAEHVRPVHDQGVGRGDVQPAFDDRGREQDVVLALVEGGHHLLELGRRHLAVADDVLHLRHLGAQELLDVGQVLDARHDEVGLAAAILLAQQRLAQGDRVPGRDVGAHRQPVDRRGGDDRHLADPAQRHLQRARDRRGGQGQHVHVGAKLLELLLVLDPEVLLLVDDDQAQVLEADLLGQDGVGADHDLQLAVGQALAGLGRLLRRRHARQAPHLDRPALEALGEGLVVLAGQQGRRADDGHLLAAHGHDEGGAQRHLGLAEADVAADQPVHRLARGQVLEHVVDGAQLVVRLLVGEAGAELVEQAGRRIGLLDRLQLAGGGDLDQPLRHLAQALLRFRLAALPAGPAQPVQLHGLAVGAVAGQQVDVLDRQVELGLAAVEQVQAVMRRALHVQRLEALVAADAVVDVHDQVARRQGAGLGQEVGGAALLARPRQPVAEDVGLGDDHQIVGLEPGLQRQHDALRDLRIIGLGRLPVGRERHAAEAMVGHHAAEALGGAFGPGGQQDPTAGGGHGFGVFGGGLEQVDAVLGPFGGKGAAELGAHVDDAGAVALERREPAVGALRDPHRDLVAGQIQRLRRQRTIGGLAVGGGPGVVGVGDHRQPLGFRLLDQVVDPDQRLVRQIVEQGLHPLVEQRQPVLHARPATALADGGIEGVLARRAEGGDIALAEAADGLGIDQRLADRQQVDFLQLPGRTLGLGVEAADALQRVAEQVQPHRLLGRRREDVDHPAANGELAALGHRRGAGIAVDREIALQVGDLHLLAGPGAVAGAGHDLARRHPLQRGGRGRDQQGRLLRVQPARQPRQGRHPVRRDRRGRPDPVVGQAVPGRQLQHLDLGREEAHRLHEGVGPRPVAGDEHRQPAARAGDVGHDQRVEPLRRTGQVQTAVVSGNPLQVVVARPAAVSRHRPALRCVDQNPSARP